MSHQDHSLPAEAGGRLAGASHLHELLTEPGRWALFLDIDGTLIDLAPTPDAIAVPPSLPDDLSRLSKRLGGALALVTGRALAYADALFQPHTFPIAGLHGAEKRDPGGTISRAATGPEFETIKAALAREASQWPGVLIEDKGAAVAAHYRQAPERQETVEAAMQRYLAMAGPGFTLQRGKMVLEIRPAQASKGQAVKAFLEQKPFAERKPITIGDDVTDEAMFRVANELGGCSIRIDETPGPTDARFSIPSAAELRAVLAALASDTHHSLEGSMP